MPGKSLTFLLFGEDVTAGKAFKKLGADAEASGSKVKGAFGKGTMLAIGGLALGLGEAVKAAGNFQQKTNVLVTAAGESAKNLGLIRRGIESVAMSTGTSINELTDAAYVAEKAGYRGADAITLLRAASQGAREEGAQLSTVLNAQTSIMASYHLKASDSVMVINEMKTAAGEAKTTMENFAGALSTVLPIASANKISFADVAGSMATLTQHGTSADEATQELANTIRNLAKPNAVAQKEMAQLGISANDVALHVGDGPGGRGLAGTLAYLSETVLKKMGPAGTVLLKTFNQSKDAAAAARTQYAALGPAAQQLAAAYASGSLSLADWRMGLKELSGPQASLATQWATTENAAKGFQSTLRAGLTNNQTYTAAIGKMTGGVNGLNTTLQLTGESLAGTKQRIATIAAAAKDAGTSVSGWESTQKLFNVQLDILKQRAEVAGIEIGTRLLPVLTAGAKFASDHATEILGLAAAYVTLKVGITTVGLLRDAWTAGSAVIRAAVSGLQTAYLQSLYAMDAAGTAFAGRQGVISTEVQAAMAAQAAAAEETAAAEATAAAEGEAAMAGSAAGIGLSLGAAGPIGLAAVGLGGILAIATKGFGLFGKGAQDQVKPVQSLTQAILDDGDALGKLTQQQANNKLASDGAYDAALKLGVSQSTVLAATMGNANAQKTLENAVNGAFEAYGKATQGTRVYDEKTNQWITTQGKATQAQKDAKAAADKLAGSVAGLSQQLAASKTEADNEKAAADGLAAALHHIPNSVKTTVQVAGVGAAKQMIRSVVDYANGQIAVIHVTTTNPLTGRTTSGQQVFGATGGIVTRPTRAIIGEAGPEMVIPLNKMPGNRALPDKFASSGGGPNITVHVHTGATLATKAEIARTVLDAIAYGTKNGQQLRVAGRAL